MDFRCGRFSPPYPLSVLIRLCHTKSPFRSDVTSRDFANCRTSIKTNRMCSRTEVVDVEVFAQWWTFVRCLAAQIVRTERRTNDVIVFPQSCRERTTKSKLWASNIERLGSPVLEGKILQLTLLNFTEFAVTIYIRYRTWCKAQFTRYRFLLLFLN